MELDTDDVVQIAGTGSLPPSGELDELLGRAHERALGHHEGVVADYIPILATADPEAFGVCIADVAGQLHEIGQTRIEFSISRLGHSSTRFVRALGHHRAFDVVVNNTGLRSTPCSDRAERRPSDESDGRAGAIPPRCRAPPQRTSGNSAGRAVPLRRTAAQGGPEVYR